MKDDTGKTIKKSLRVKVFGMNMQLVAVAVVIFAVVGILQLSRFAGLMEAANREQNAVIMETMSDSMRAAAADSCQKYVLSQAKVLDGEFWTMRHDFEVLARQVQMGLEHPSSFSPLPVPLPSEAEPGSLSLQLLYSENADRSDPELEKQILRIGGLRNMILEIVEGSDTLLDCMVSLPGGASIIADRTPESKLDENGKDLPYNADRRPWYVGAIVHKDTYFTPVNVDNYFNFKEVMAGVPVYVDGELAAVCGGSVRLDEVEDIIAKSTLGDSSDICLINEYGNVLYSSREDGDLGVRVNELKSLKESGNAELVALVNKALEGGTGFSFLEIDGEGTYIAYASMDTVGWTLLLSVSLTELNRTAYVLTEQTDVIMENTISDSRVIAQKTIRTNLLIALFLIALSVLTSMLFADHLLKPIKRMTMRVSEMQGDDMSFKVEDIYLTKDEIEVLARAFSNMSEQMRGYVREIVHITAEKQRLDTELSVASEIQTNMLPNRFPAFPDRDEFDLYAVMDPAKEVGGDFYDFFLIDDDHLALVMADVSGKGVPAALFMVISKTLIKNVTLSGGYSGPGEILQDVNDRLCEGNEDNMFVTVWLGILTISTGQVVSACAGHEYPVFYRSETGFVLEKDPHGMALGVMEGLRYKEARWHLNPGDLLFLYTDGVPEATNAAEELFGNDRMMAALAGSWDSAVRTVTAEDSGPGVAAESAASAERPGRGAADQTDSPKGWRKDTLEILLRGIREHVDDFAGDAPQFDDLTMMCVSYLGSREQEKPQNGEPQEVRSPL